MLKEKLIFWVAVPNRCLGSVSQGIELCQRNRAEEAKAHPVLLEASSGLAF